LGICDYLADIDCSPDWHYCHATTKNPPIVEGIRREMPNYFIEIHSINLKPGRCEEFHRLYIEQALPLLKRWNFDVVAYGPSLHDENLYYVIRRFDEELHRYRT
jgi:hypothetical protein